MASTSQSNCDRLPVKGVRLNIKIPGLNKLPLVLQITFILLIAANLARIVITHITGHDSMGGILPLVDVNRENSLPTWFSTINLFMSAILLFSIYGWKKQQKSPDRVYWLYLAIVFLLLSADESASIHEIMGIMMDKTSISVNWIYYSWLIPGIFIALALFVFLIKFYLRLPRRYQILFGLSAALLFGGVFVMEFIDGFAATDSGPNTVIFELLVTVEESLEMVGVILFIYSLIDYKQVNESAKNGNETPGQAIP
jgi:hypothetical protein